MDGSDVTETHRPHKSIKKGRGAKEKKKDKKAKDDNTRVVKHNNRAFSVANVSEYAMILHSININNGLSINFNNVSFFAHF